MPTKKKKTNWIQAGVIGVDAGLCWIGDPCYIIKDNGEKPHPGMQSWRGPGGFCDMLFGLSKKDEQRCDALHEATMDAIRKVGFAAASKVMLANRRKADRIRNGKPYRQWNYKAGHAGLGVSMSTGYGDGTYPVFVRLNKEGRVAEARIKFI